MTFAGGNHRAVFIVLILQVMQKNATVLFLLLTITRIMLVSKNSGIIFRERPPYAAVNRR